MSREPRVPSYRRHKRGRTEARESDPVKPVARAVVDDTLPVLRPILADMVRVQLETGMRPGETGTRRPARREAGPATGRRGVRRRHAGRAVRRPDGRAGVDAKLGLPPLRR
jgi:hypothetical protein